MTYDRWLELVQWVRVVAVVTGWDEDTVCLIADHERDLADLGRHYAQIMDRERVLRDVLQDLGVDPEAHVTRTDQNVLALPGAHLRQQLQALLVNQPRSNNHE